MTNAPSTEQRRGTLGFGARLAIILGTLAAEKVLLNKFVDFNEARAAQTLGATLHEVQHWGFRFVSAFAAALILFAWVRSSAELKHAAAEIGPLAVRMRWLALHGALLAVMVPLTFALFHLQSGPALAIVWIAAFWSIAALGAVLALGLTFCTAALWWRLARSLGLIWVFAALAALLGSAAIKASEMLWASTAGFTFRAVAYLLRGTIPHLQLDPATRLIRSDHFAVVVTDDCSGLEGVGLILAFLVCWLVYFRGEYRFPRALMLFAVGPLLIFGLNILRIAAFMMIGDAGNAEVAIYGFHSQAGWISFIGVAGGLAAISLHSPWLSRRAALQRHEVHTRNPTAEYLAPLLTILAAGLISHALSGRFETFYPLRVIAVALVLWRLRRHWGTMDWRLSWRGFALGAGVFALWWAFAHWLLPAEAAPDAFLSLSPWARGVWLVSRVVGAVATVPLAEELAYRGFLMRRLQEADFDHLPYLRVQWAPLGISAVAFGIMHGALWSPGIVAGFCYGWIAKKRDSLGEAIVAHATTNALCAACVLCLADWRMW